VVGRVYVVGGVYVMGGVSVVERECGGGCDGGCDWESVVGSVCVMGRV